jgi:hypothetical protein
VRGGREIEEEVGRVLRSLHSREKRDVRTRVLQALIACTRERERERVWRQEVGEWLSEEFRKVEKGSLDSPLRLW